jgi:hypothetical protein
VLLGLRPRATDRLLTGQEGDVEVVCPLHPAPDQSPNMTLPPALALDAIESGRAEQHPVARRGLIPPNVRDAMCC